LYWDKTHLLSNKSALKNKFTQPSNKLLIVIHCREAFDEIFEILEEEKSDLFGIFHCFQELIGFKRFHNMKLGIGVLDF
jgi:TatD DNase family protein